ncbi:MAG: hypothetical protein RL745_691, partial [Actinomycetota bacterium]
MNPANVVTSGPLWLAVLVALGAGALSFASPCILPLVPGYLSYVAANMNGATKQRAAVIRGTLLFILGFATVFTAAGAAFGGLGKALSTHARPMEQVLGVVVIIM